MTDKSQLASHQIPLKLDSVLQKVFASLFVFTLSYLAARLGGLLVFRPQMIWPLWPGCALLVAILLLTARRNWPFLLLAGLAGFALYDLREGLAVRSIALLLAGDSVEILIAALGVNYVFHGVPQLNSVRSLAKYCFFAVIVAPIAVASVAVHAIEGDSWWIGFLTEALALLTLTPAILGLVNIARRRVKKATVLSLEAASMFFALAILAYVAFMAPGSQYRPALLYLLVPFLLWAALRFGITGTTNALILVAVIAILGVVHGHGPFAGHTPLQDVLSLQLFLLVTASSFMVLAAVVEKDEAAEQTVRRSEERLRLAQQVARIGTFEWNIQTGVNTWTPELEEMYGLPPGGFGGTQTAFENLVHPADRAGVIELNNWALKTGKPTKGEWRVVWPDGSVHWIAGRWQVLTDESGEPSRMIGVNADVTERKLVDEAKFRLAAIVESSEDAIISKNLDWVITSWNAGAEHIFGYTEQEAVGQPITILIPLELRDEESRIFERLRTGERINHYETIRVTKAGKKVSVSLSISPVKDSTGRIVGFSKIARDITQRKRAEEALRESEERFRLAAQAGKVYAYENRLPTGTVVRSSEYAKILRLTEPEHFTYQQFLDGIHPDDRSTYLAAVAALTPENPTSEVTYRFLCPDGGVVWLKSSGRGFFDREQKLVRVVGMVADVTEHKRSEEAMSTVSSMLIQAQEKERTRIARELHDDINQKLAMLAVELEQLGDDPSTLRNRVQELRKEAVEISNDVQALSHELHSSKLEYLGVVAGMKSWCKEFAERQKMEVDFSTDVAHPLPLEIGLCLFRVQQEALHNAVKHSGVKQVDVQLAESSNEWLLTVSDSGVGFDLEAAKQGRGLGLTSMQERVRLVNGTITVESKLRGGTTIHVRVPFNSGHASRRAAS